MGNEKTHLNQRLLRHDFLFPRRDGAGAFFGGEGVGPVHIHLDIDISGFVLEGERRKRSRRSRRRRREGDEPFG